MPIFFSNNCFLVFEDQNNGGKNGIQTRFDSTAITFSGTQKGLLVNILNKFQLLKKHFSNLKYLKS